ncbi:hypothetical protein E2986_07145 [Frieseomelitta varia]|uniref:Uncharacterized protein n=1 Tax=Frieseomelitta varia TaxID=561572 RepID=A0A833RZ44_9HYME|nr:hypothetical protein E2986_07145 [Frieseomelitta varia]
MEVLDPSVSRDDQPLCVNDSLEKVTIADIPSDTKSCVKARHTLGFLGFLGFALVYAMRVNLSVAIVSMVNQTAIPHSDDNDTTDVCPKEKPINGTFIPGVTFPAMHSMLAHWVPPLERSKFAAVVYAGANFGTVISLPVSGWLCSLELWGGWPLAFYLFGGLGIVWYAFWLIFVYDTPAQHTKIDPLERAYIEASVEKKDEDDDPGVPWLSVFTSLPMWAIAITQCGQSWAFYTLLTELPTYMDKILHFDVQQDAFLSALPYLSSWLFGLGISSFADALLARQLISPLASFKLWNTVASLGPSLSFIGAIWAECNRMTVMMMLAGLGSLQGAVYAGNQMNHIALAPRYAGTLYGLTNAAANACGFLAPYVIGRIVQGHETLARWHTVFWLAAGINMATNCFYLIFASATEQPWSKGRS